MGSWLSIEDVNFLSVKRKDWQSFNLGETNPSIDGWLKSPVFFWGWAFIFALTYLILPGYLFCLAIGFILLAVLSLISPFATLCLTICLLPLESVHYFVRYTSVYDVRYYPFHLMTLLTLASFCIHKIIYRRPICRTPISTLLQLLVIFECISICWSPVKGIGMHLIFQLLMLYTLYFLITNILTDYKDIEAFLRVLTVAGVMTATCVVLSQWIEVSVTYFLSPESGIQLAFQTQVERPAGIGGAINTAEFIVFCAYGTLGLLLRADSRKKGLFMMVLITYMVVAVLLTVSRGGTVSIIFTSLFLFYIYKPFRKRFLRMSVFLVFFLAMALLVVKPGFVDRLLVGFGYQGELFFSDEGAYSGTSSKGLAAGEGLSGMEIRMIWWRNALDEMLREPLKLIFGLGLGGFIKYSSGTNTVTSPEVNSYHFAFFYDLGLVGCILYIAILYGLFISIRDHMRQVQESPVYPLLLAVVCATIAVTFINGLIDNDLTSYGAKYFWVPLAFTMAALRSVVYNI